MFSGKHKPFLPEQGTFLTKRRWIFSLKCPYESHLHPHPEGCDTQVCRWSTSGSRQKDITILLKISYFRIDHMFAE